MKQFVVACTFVSVCVPGFCCTDEPGDFTELSKLIHKIVIKDLPKEFTDTSDWGRTVPIPPKLRLPNLRTKVKVGDNEELPHGLWKKARLWLDEPAKDVAIKVRELRRLGDSKSYRLGVDATLAFNGIREWQHWQKGLATFGASAQARATIMVSLDIDVALSLGAGKFPPELKIEPKVVESKLLLKEFDLLRVTPIYGLGALLEGEKAKEIGNEFKGLIQTLLTAHEPTVRDQANRIIAQALKEGKGNISAGALFKALAP